MQTGAIVVTPLKKFKGFPLQPVPLPSIVYQHLPKSTTLCVTSEHAMKRYRKNEAVSAILVSKTLVGAPQQTREVGRPGKQKQQ